MATPNPSPEPVPVDRPGSSNTSEEPGQGSPGVAAAEEVEPPIRIVDLVDMKTFGQLLDLDEDGDHSFSKPLTLDYCDQADATLAEMDKAMESKDLVTLSRKGHFLKGSSAALGLQRVKASCERMQHYGNGKTADGEGTLSVEEAEKMCRDLLVQLKEEQKQSRAYLEEFFSKPSPA